MFPETPANQFKMTIKNNTIKTLTSLLFVILTVLPAGAGNTEKQKNYTGKIPKNIIIMFTDGTGTALLETARLYMRHVHEEDFFLTDTLLNEASLGLMSTYSASSLVTDSAAAGSAMSTGYKSYNGSINVNVQQKPVGSVAELIKKKGGKLL
ncbi:MAG: hypothetical protein D3922_01835 [Candidatus Electrothrix sp. AR1]|nr:hypothetical protein [Candidatus Electrothrix sp. AR1]